MDVAWAGAGLKAIVVTDPCFSDVASIDAVLMHVVLMAV